MTRFTMNRWWTIFLALALVCAYQAGSTPKAHAASPAVNGFVTGGDDIGGGGTSGGAGIGDPDVPTAVKGRAGHGSLNSSSGSARAAGDGTREPLGMMRLRAVMIALRMRWLGF